MHNSKYQCKWQPWDSRQGGVAHAITLHWPTGTCWHSVPVLQSTMCRWRGLAKRQVENLQLDHKEWQWTFFEVKIKMRTKKNKKTTKNGGDVAQLVEHQTGTLLMQVRFPGAARYFFPRVHFQCRLSYVCPYTPVCNRIHLHLCARSKFCSPRQSSVDYGNTKTPSMHGRLGSPSL